MNKIKEYLHWMALIFILTTIPVFLFWLFIPKSDPKGAESALVNAGYKNIEITGAEFSGCGKKYSFSTKFNAEDSTGKMVRGVVCSGFLYPSIISKRQRSESDNYFSSALIILGIVGGVITFFVARRLGFLKRFYPLEVESNTINYDKKNK